MLIKRDDESVTEFTIRRIRAEILNEAIAAIEKCSPPNYCSDDAIWYEGQQAAIQAVEALHR